MTKTDSDDPAFDDEHSRALAVGARLRAPPAPELVDAFAGELDGQRGLVDEIGLADLAHTVMCIEQDLIPTAEGRELLRALLALQERPSDFVLDPAAGDLYTNREAWLFARTPAAGWLGFGRARREATTTAWKIAVRRGVIVLADALAEFGLALTERAAELRDAYAPDYTYQRAAQPTSFGHTLLAFVFPILRDLDRLDAVYRRANRCPAGNGSANGSRLAQDRPRLSALLGFDGLVHHARDAMWEADLPIESMAVVVAAMVNLNRFAEDFLFFSTDEVGLLSLADSHARASKILPQKRNPYALTWIRACANEVIGVQAGIAASARTPTGQIDSRLLAYAEVPRALHRAANVANLAAAVARGFVFHPDRGGELLARTFVGASDLAETIVTESKLDHRTAQRVVGVLARTLADSGGRVSSLSPADVDLAAVEVTGDPVGLSTSALASALDAAQAVTARMGPGGAAGPRVDDMVNGLRAEFETTRRSFGDERNRATSATNALVARAAAMAGAR